MFLTFLELSKFAQNLDHFRDPFLDYGMPFGIAGNPMWVSGATECLWKPPETQMLTNGLPAVSDLSAHHIPISLFPVV